MTISYKSAWNRVVWAACFAATSLNWLALADADHPSFPITVELGPGNDDFKSQILGGDAGFSEIVQSFSRLDNYDMSNRDLRMAELHLYSFELTGVRFDGADLTAANFVETGFDNCSFRNAIMRRVSLAGARYINPNCDLTGADITGSDLWLSREQLESTKNYQLRDLSGTTLTGGFEGVDFAGFNLNGTTLNSDLTGCNMAGASVLGSTLQLSKEQLASTNTFESGDINSVTLRGGDFSGFDFSKVNLGLFISCDLSNADLTDACFAPGSYYGKGVAGKHHGFVKCEIAPEQIYSTRNYKIKKFPPGFYFEGMNLAGWDFGGMDLRGVTFHVCDMTDANLQDARGGIFLSAKGLTAEQMRSTWNYRNNKMAESGFSLPSSLSAELNP